MVQHSTFWSVSEEGGVDGFAQLHEEAHGCPALGILLVAMDCPHYVLPLLHIHCLTKGPANSAPLV